MRTVDLAQPIKSLNNLILKDMILDLEKIANLEKRYSDKPVTLNALSNMVAIVSSACVSEDAISSTVPYLTLCDLGVIKTSEKTPIPLNS